MNELQCDRDSRVVSLEITIKTIIKITSFIYTHKLTVLSLPIK